MRERNKKFLNNIGNLMEEINNQDLEAVNGGQDITKDPIQDFTMHSIATYLSCNCPQELSNDPICEKITDVVIPVVTKLLDCK